MVWMLGEGGLMLIDVGAASGAASAAEASCAWATCAWAAAASSDSAYGWSGTVGGIGEPRS